MPTTTTFSRTQIIAVLKDLGNLCALAGENHFKTRAYQKAVDAFEEMKDIVPMGKIMDRVEAVFS